MIADNKNQKLSDNSTVGNGYCGNSNLLLKEDNCSPVILPRFEADF